MNKTIKVLALTTNQNLISEIEEVGSADIGEPDCKLINPFLIKEGNVLEPFLINITKDDEFMMGSDKILTICEPMPTLLEKYLNLTK